MVCKISVCKALCSLIGNNDLNSQDDEDGDFDVYLTDCSQNGTFVNGELVGKWKVHCLSLLNCMACSCIWLTRTSILSIFSILINAIKDKIVNYYKKT